MGLTHIRTPRNFVLEERLERYADAIEEHPEAYRGRWAEACWPLAVAGPGSAARGGEAPDAQAIGTAPSRFAGVHLDLGCGKGAYLIERARREPRRLFIGMDTEPICIAYAAQYICEAGLSNALVLPRGADSIQSVFAPGELSGITLNFPTPYPKRKFAARRLVHVEHLLLYRDVLGRGAAVTLRTDSKPLRDYALAQFDAAGYKRSWVSDDVRAEHPEHPVTEYEARLSAQGARVYGICAVPGPAPSPEQVQRGREAEQSLVAYLPQDLDAMGYVPLGMEGAVVNLRNRARNARRGTVR